MNRDNVVSSNINSIGYDSATKTLEIEFHSGGTYQYYDVPESEYNGLMAASSHGSYFHANIKNRYTYKKI
ncbi:KTSC domain-containing protein [Methanobrevibacter sp. TMH8]|uniref:KTSC domain-containing protein n=1 Tax=Methanobrevibacter sp. TMH8 TaxID=2848611 RepID=UPI001CCDAF19|nr:KTSC domain-containing protein [Methanobrevibacter sp. TMH8]MBZ9570579.1 KTSC domain-containing protein [Methanobrevibacter sp. TMH8]